MATVETRENARHIAIHREEHFVDRPINNEGQLKRISEYYGELTFDIQKADSIPAAVKKEFLDCSTLVKPLARASAEIIAIAVTEWALSQGATHFCHWFQPLTGGTAEKQDSFLDLKNGEAIERLSASQLIQGEPDASSFPNGGSRSTFEARGYTSWDLSSPLFLVEGTNGTTLCIPTAFVSYTGEALDMKTPLLRSVSKMSEVATKFMNLVGHAETKKVTVTTGCEQEYFLIDKAYYYARPDLVQTGRTLFGKAASKHQQLDDHYFGFIPSRIMSFMQELDLELHRLGIPSKTRHNEVAPGQFELAPIFSEANVSSDNNQMIMALVRRIARKHDLVALLHEKPFAGINGSGKHVNWSMADNTGINLLDPGKEPQNNMRFLATIAMVCEAVHRHAGALRASISSAGNDHRLGANEAPPSIISVFLGDTIDAIFESIREGKSFTPSDNSDLDLGANQLSNLKQDNTDRNRTSPFAFTGNRFEFRAVGSASSVSFPTAVLNAAVADVMNESNSLIEKDLAAGKSIDDALLNITKKWATSAKPSIFNGDGYSDEWVEEADKRGLLNLKTTPEALTVFTDSKQIGFLSEQGVMSANELEMRHNVLLERYITLREIEFNALEDLINQNVIPSVIDFKLKLSQVIINQKNAGLECSVEVELYKKLNFSLETLGSQLNTFKNGLEGLDHDEQKRAQEIAEKLFPLSEELGEICADLEGLMPDNAWALPKYYEMLHHR